MEQTKNLCAQIPITLHTRVRQEQEKSGKTLSEYITEVLSEYYEGGYGLFHSEEFHTAGCLSPVWLHSVARIPINDLPLNSGVQNAR